MQEKEARVKSASRVEVMGSYVPSYPVGKAFKGNDYLPWGDDNLEAVRWKYFIDNSPTLSSCVSTKARFIEGNGFNDEKFYRAVINRRGLRVDGLLKKLSPDVSGFGGFAWQLNYKWDFRTGRFVISEINPIPARKIRLGLPDDVDYIGKIAVVNNVENLKKKGVKRDETQYFDVFNPNQKIIEKQIEAAGGIQNWTGQVFYWFNTDSYYPEPQWLAVKEDVLTEIAAKQSKTADAYEGFSGKTHVTEYGTSAPDPEKLATDKAKYTGFKGPKGGRIMVHYAENPETAVKFDNFPSGDLAKNYEYTENSARDTIRQNFGMPSILYGMETPGKLGISDQDFDQVAKYVQRIVINSDQRAVMDAFETVFEHFEDIDLINPKGENGKRNYVIENLSLVSVENNTITTAEEVDAPEPTGSQMAIRGTVGWVDAVLAIKASIVANPADYESGIVLLKEMAGYSDATARALLGKSNGTTTDNQS